MEFYEVIQDRTSVRKFKSNPICKDKLSRMINAAMMAPSWKNQTSYKIIIVEDKSKREQLANTIINSTDKAANSVKDAPVTMVIVANPDKSGVVGDKQYYLVDSAIAMEHFILAATNEGYGTCWIGALVENEVKNILNIPNEYKVVGMTPVGEIDEDKEHYPKKDIKEYVFLNHWNNGY